MRIEVAVQPRAGRNSVEMVDGESLKVKVTAAAADDKANAAVVALLSKRLGVPKGRIAIVRGRRSRRKVLLLQGVDRGTLLERLGAEGR